MRLRKDNVYLIKDAHDNIFKAQYMGRQEGFSCCICYKGNNAYTFNVWDSNGYETLGYGKEHFPQVLEDLGPIEFDEKDIPQTKYLN